MTREQYVKTSSPDREITRLVNQAGERGRPDPYQGKRSAIRFREGMRLEVCMDPGASPPKIQSAVMHDVSEGGFSFWTKTDVSNRTRVHVREYSSGRENVWLAAEVKHRTVGIRGFLIGAEFDRVDQRAKEHAHPQEAAAPPDMTVPTGMSTVRQRLAGR